MNLRVIRSSSRWRELQRIDGNAPFGAAVGKIDDGRFPGHQRRQRTDFVQIDLRMVAQAALHRPARIVVLHPVADERGQFAVVQLDGNFHLHFAARNQQQPPHVVGQIHLIGGPIEIQPRGVESAHEGRPWSFIDRCDAPEVIAE